MTPATPISLSVRPFQVSHLCFATDGILEISATQLGAHVNAFDFPAFYAILRSVPTVVGDLSLLQYNFPEIDTALTPYALAALRNEPQAVSLSKAVLARQNAFFAKFSNAPDIIARMNEYYSPTVSGSKPVRLEILSALADKQFNELKTAYTTDTRLGVVKTTKSVLDSTSKNTETTTASGSSTVTGQSNEEDKTGIGLNTTGNDFVSDPPPKGENFPPYDLSAGSVDQEFQEGTSQEKSTSSDTAKTKGSGSEHQTITNTDYAYRVPYLESAAQLERAQISLIDQQFAQFMAGQSLPHLPQVFLNELISMDGDVYRLQVAYANTILMSPIEGTVTGVYKYPGDAVRAGEPVVRVEDNRTFYLMATVRYRGPIGVNTGFQLNTKLYGSASLASPLLGEVVSARGHGDDDTWELIVKCSNPLDAAGNLVFPIGYHFDFDDTTIDIL